MANTYDSELETPEMESLASLAENLVYRLPGCDDLMVRKTLQDVYRDFCRRSCCLNGRRHFILGIGESTMSISSSSDMVVDAVVQVTYNGRRLMTNRDYSVRYGTIPVVRLSPRFVAQEGTDESSLPKVDVMFVEFPKIGSERVPSWFVQRFGDAVCCGVLARLQAMTGKAWSDASEASANRISYENAINDAKICYYAGDYNGDCGTAVNAEDLI